MAKKNTGRRNFNRFIALLGLIVVGFLINEFLGAAPSMTNRPFHKDITPMNECLECHVKKSESNPIMPHRPMESCTFCHKEV